jgi:hypothetical protein
LTGCNSENYSDNRTADIILLEMKINDIELEISHINMQIRKVSSNSRLSQKKINMEMAKIRELESEREILVNELMAISKTEDEYQSKK